MRNNMEKVIDRGEKLEDLEDKTGTSKLFQAHLAELSKSFMEMPDLKQLSLFRLRYMPSFLQVPKTLKSNSFSIKAKMK